MRSGALLVAGCILLIALQLTVVDAQHAPTAEFVEESYSETPRTNGYGYSFSGAWRELKASFWWALIGIVMCCVSFPCLYWNEGRQVTREIVLDKAEERAIPIGTVTDASKPSDANTGKLIHFDGVPYCTSEVQYDTQLGVAAAEKTHAKNMSRTVEMFMWVTDFRQEQRRTGRYDSNGKEEMETVKVILEPKKEWQTLTGPPSQPELPEGWENRRDEFHNEHPCDFESERFQRGVVLLGPYFLTMGMVESEMRTIDKALEPSVDAIMGFVATGGEAYEASLSSAEPPSYDDSVATVPPADDDDKNDPANEETGLLSKEGSGEGSGSGSSSGFGIGMGYGKAPLTLSEKSKDFLNNTRLTVNGKVLYMGEDPEHEQLFDYKVSWTSYHLPTESNGSVCVHTVLAEQRRKSSGAFGLKAWMPDDVEEFHIDSCCKCVCYIGYTVVEGGCIDAVDSCVFPNASSDANQEDTDIESAGSAGSDKVAARSVASNSLCVEKLTEGTQSIKDIIEGMDAQNAAKTSFYRKLGFLLMFLGFQFTMSPFPTVFHFFPWVGHAVGFVVYIALFIIALTLACFGAITTISIAWLRYRPLWGILGIAVAGGIAAAIIFFNPSSF
jgi:hypothetical protein